MRYTQAVFTAIFVVEWACRAYAFGGVRAVTRSPFQMADLFTTVVLALVFIDEVCTVIYDKNQAYVATIGRMLL